MDFINLSVSFGEVVVNHLLFEDLQMYLTVQKPEESVGLLKLTNELTFLSPQIEVPTFNFQTSPSKRKITAVPKISQPKVCNKFLAIRIFFK